MSRRNVVAVVHTQAATVLDDIRRLMRLADVSAGLNPGCQTILKDNISWHLFFPAANTTPWQLEGTILGLRENGFNDLLAVHNETVVTKAAKGSRENRLDVVYKKYNIPEIDNFNPREVEWIIYKPQRPTPALNRVYPEGFRIPRQFQNTNIVHLPTVKCHIYTTTTGAIKNAFGGLLNTRRHYTHTHIHRTLVDLLIVQKEIHTGLFAVMDGTHAGDGPGPRTMRPVEKNIMLAASDQVAIDAVAARLMGFDPLSIGYIRMAHEEGLGVGNPRDIELKGDDISGENWNFNVGDNFASRIGDILWFGPLKGIQKLFFHTPLVNLFVVGSYLYHDCLWYPCFSRKRLRRFARTQWGRLFEERYGSGGSLLKNS